MRKPAPVMPPRRRNLPRDDVLLLRRCETIRVGDVLRVRTARGRLTIAYTQNATLRRGYRIELNGALLCTIVSAAGKAESHERTLAARLAAWCKKHRFDLRGAELDPGAAAEHLLAVRRPVVPPPICRPED